MKTAICTISTVSHLFKTRALFDGLRPLTNADFFCLMTDGEEELEGVQAVRLESLDNKTALGIRKKYKGDELRWSCKPLLLEHLLNMGYEAVIYVDNDIYFYSSPDFLFDEIKEKPILLTPHFYPADPAKDQHMLEANFRVGLFNGGFVGAGKSGLPALQWWSSCCLYNVKKAFWRGLFDDQKYLDLLPVLFDAEILKHKGCNVAGWNREMSPRSLDAEGNVWLDGKWPLVFVHFTHYTIDQAMKGNEPALKSCWETYLAALKKFQPTFHPAEETRISVRILKLYVYYFRWRIARKMEG